jgi:hypothetical protein
VKKADQKKESEENATKGSQTLKFRLLPQGGVGVGVGGLMRCNHVGAYEFKSWPIEDAATQKGFGDHNH